jgi:predicted SprT family Zn-dependent metalloprotease
MDIVHSSKNNRITFSTQHNSSILLYKCDGCNLFKNMLSIHTDKKERGYLCEYCTKSNLFSSNNE